MNYHEHNLKLPQTREQSSRINCGSTYQSKARYPNILIFNLQDTFLIYLGLEAFKSERVSNSCDEEKIRTIYDCLSYIFIPWGVCSSWKIS